LECGVDLECASRLETFARNNQRIEVQSFGLPIASENPKQTPIPIEFKLGFIPMVPGSMDYYAKSSRCQTIVSNFTTEYEW